MTKPHRPDTTEHLINFLASYDRLPVSGLLSNASSADLRAVVAISLELSMRLDRIEQMLEEDDAS